MAAYRVDLLTHDPDPVFEWLDAQIPPHLMIRRVGYKTVRGWYMKVVFKRQEDAEAFHRQWHPEAEDHSVSPWGDRYGRRARTA